MFFFESGHKIVSQGSKTCTSTGRNIVDINGKTMYLHNSGNYPVYLGNSIGITSTGWELPSGEKSGPWTGNAEVPNLYLLGSTQGSSVVKYLRVAPW